MNSTELNEKIAKFKAELKADIETFVKENAKFKVGDVITTPGWDRGAEKFYVITQLGFRDGEIVYYGNKVTKSTGEISFMDMHSNVGMREYSIVKSTLMLKNKEISFIEDHKYFDRTIKHAFNK